jgi:hypothetical protein
MLYLLMASLMLSLNARAGKCSIVDAKNCPKCFCDFYAKTSKAGLLGVGLPHGYGSGCIVAPDSPRRIDTCWGAPPMCTTNTTTAKPPSVALA